jgi:predicted amidohydrolase
MGLKLALWQGAGHAGDLGATLNDVARIAARAAKSGADLLVFPEGFLTGYYLPDLEPGGLPGIDAALGEVAQIAARSGLAVVMGTHLDAPEGLRNAAVVFGPSGLEIGRYYKRTMFGAWEQATFLRGVTPLRFDCAGLRVGVAICYDVEFPELIRAEARAGVDLVVVPTALMAPHDHVARMVVPVRALENQIFIGYANRCGHEHDLDFVGLSSIRDPLGIALAEAGGWPELLIADIDSDAIRSARADFCYLDDLPDAV